MLPAYLPGLERRGCRADRVGGGDSTATAIATWVAATYTATTVGGSTVYDLSTPAA